MNHNSENSGPSTNVAETSNIHGMLYGLMGRYRTVCILSGAVMAVAYAAFTVSPETTVLAAQSGNETSDSSGMMIVPRGGDVQTGMIPAWRAPTALSEAKRPAASGTRSRTTNPSEQGPTRSSLHRPVSAQNTTKTSEHTNTSVNRHSGLAMIRPASGGKPRGRGQVQEDGTLLIPPEAPQTQMVTPPPYRPDERSMNESWAPDHSGPALDARNNQSSAVYPDDSNISPADPNVMNSGPSPYDGSYAEPPVYQSPVGQPDGGIVAPPPGRPNLYFAPGASGFRATVEYDAPAWMDPYYGRTERMPIGREGSPTPPPSVQLPVNFVAWWDPLVRQSAGLAPQTIPVEVVTLVQQALAHAPQVQVLQADPEVQFTIVRQEAAAFDWRTFLDAKYNDLNYPVGNTLTLCTGGTRYLDTKLYTQGGIKRRTPQGGELQIAQTIGHQYNNSIFLKPNAQSNTRLELSFRQPLMSKAGTVYNQNQIVLAGINSNISSDETLQELQKHLYEVTQAYWSLYRARSEFFQRQKLLVSSQRVLVTLEGRNQVDTIPRQILRARAAVARAESRMQRAVTDIRNAESQLRLLVNDPSMINCGPLEFTPSESPASMPSPIGLRETLETALVNRPDISRAIRQMRASSVQIGVSKSELLPRLDFIVSSYVAGLQAHSQIFPSIGDQFSYRPGYTAGFEFEIPLGNRAAKAKMEQRQWELKRAISAFRVTVETSLTEVEISTRNVDTSYRDMLGKYQAMVAAQNEVAYLQDRFDTLPRIEDSTMLLLEDLLSGYERLADEESAFVQAQTEYALSIIQLRRTTGTLMRTRTEAPDIKAEENEWMTARAEQTADDTDERAIRVASQRSRSIPADSDGPPAEWSQPVDAPSTRYAGPGLPDQRPVQRNNAVQPASYGGHSFGTK